MRSIKHALTERYYTWQEAVDVAMSDPEIDLHADDGQVYKPSTYEEDFEGDDSWKDAPSAHGTEEPAAKTDKELTR